MEDIDMADILTKNTTPEQGTNMNARLIWILLQESIEEASNRLPLDGTLEELMEIKESDIAAACSRLPSIPRSEDA